MTTTKDDAQTNQKDYSRGIEGALDFFASVPQAVASGFAFRKDALNETVDGVRIDTVRATDTKKWETGIQLQKGGDWTIVEQYPTKKDAYKGHAKWVEQVKAGKRDFKDIDLWGLGL